MQRFWQLGVQYYCIVGSWSITNSTEIDRSDSSWSDVASGFEDGVFTFKQDGAAEYTIDNNTLTGSWHLKDASDGYFSADGQYYDDSHQEL